MTGIPLDVAFREKRTYVHGTDMYNEIVRILSEQAGTPPDGPLRLVIRKMTGSGLDLIFDDGGTKNTGAVIANFSLRVGDQTHSGRLVETDRAVSGRISYDEVAIRSKATKTGSSAHMTDDPGFTPIEVLVSVTLDLLNDLIPPSTDRRWVFTRLDLSRPLRDSDRGSFAVTMTKSLGQTLTRFSVAADEPLGDIYFSLN